MSNSNTNNNKRNVFNTIARTTVDEGNEMVMLLNQPHVAESGDTTINMENNMGPGTSPQQLQRQQIGREGNTTRIDMEINGAAETTLRGIGGVIGNSNSNDNPNTDDRQRIRTIFSMFREARHQLHRSQSLRDPQIVIPATANGEPVLLNAHPRSWRENLYDVLASPVTPRTDVLRSLFTTASTANVRYNSLPTNDVPEEQFNFLLNRQTGTIDGELQAISRNGLETQSPPSVLRLSRQNSRLTDDRSSVENFSSAPQTPPELPVDNGTGGGGVGGGSSRRQSNSIYTTNGGGTGPNPSHRQTSDTGSTPPTIEMDEADTNAIGEMMVKFVSHFVRYLPFIFILFVKFIHDHVSGILDLILLHGIMYLINKSLKEQIAKLNQKSYGALIRDMILLVFVVSFRYLLSTSSPDPFGLLINPPGASLDMNVFSQNSGEEFKQVLNVPSTYVYPTPNSHNSTISVTKSLPIGVLLYYVAVNDLILKLLTQLIKITVTLLPTKFIRHKSRARLYALVEYISQFYRTLVPMRQWVKFLFESYTGLEVISGILFSAFYMGAKGFEFVERGKLLKNALMNFVRNMDYDRKPTKDELEAAGTVCPICHDSYTTPVVLECSHIFCDECVNTWFKREQTCPMCRAKVSEDPAWQDGATTYFYQLC